MSTQQQQHAQLELAPRLRTYYTCTLWHSTRSSELMRETEAEAEATPAMRLAYAACGDVDEEEHEHEHDRAPPVMVSFVGASKQKGLVLCERSTGDDGDGDGDDNRGVSANSTLFTERPLLVLQHEPSKRKLRACSHCLQSVGTVNEQWERATQALAAAAATAAAAAAARKAKSTQSRSKTSSSDAAGDESSASPSEITSTPSPWPFSNTALPFTRDSRDATAATAANDADLFDLARYDRTPVPCAAGCLDDVYCSETCRDAAWYEYHMLLCVGAPVAEDAPAAASSSAAAPSALRAFYAHADANNEIFRLVLKAIAWTMCRALDAAVVRAHASSAPDAPAVHTLPAPTQRDRLAPLFDALGSSGALARLDLERAFAPLSLFTARRWWEHAAPEPSSSSTAAAAALLTDKQLAAFRNRAHAMCRESHALLLYFLHAQHPQLWCHADVIAACSAAAPSTLSTESSDTSMSLLPHAASHALSSPDAMFPSIDVLSLDGFGRIVSIFDMNNIGLFAPSPVSTYLAHLVSLDDEGAGDEGDEGSAADSTRTSSTAERPAQPPRPLSIVKQAAGASVWTHIEDVDELRVEGTGLFALACCMNHSCAPNVRVVKRDHKAERDGFIDLDCRMAFVATRDIAPGEELCISYIDERKSLAHRQAALHSYDFVCACEKCERQRKRVERACVAGSVQQS